MWLADVMYLMYNVGCILLAFFYGVAPINWGLLGSLAILWVLVTVIYIEYRNGG